MLRDITCRTRFILTELWHLLDVSAVLGHGAVLAALLFLNKFWYQQDWQRILSFYMNMLFFFCFFISKSKVFIHHSTKVVGLLYSPGYPSVYSSICHESFCFILER